MLKEELLLKRINRSITNIHHSKPKTIYKVHTRLNSKAPITSYHYTPTFAKTFSSPIRALYHKSSISELSNPQTVNTIFSYQNKPSDSANVLKKSSKGNQTLKKDSQSLSYKQSLLHKNCSKESVCSDNRVEYTLSVLNIEEYIETFRENKVLFEDLFLLTREDYVEMKIPIGPRNRLLSFQNEYSFFAGSNTLQNIQLFFQSNGKLHHFNSGICQTECGVNLHQRYTSDNIDSNSADYSSNVVLTNKYDTIASSNSMTNSKGLSQHRILNSKDSLDMPKETMKASGMKNRNKVVPAPSKPKKNRRVDSEGCYFDGLDQNNIKEYSNQLDHDAYQHYNSPKLKEEGTKGIALNGSKQKQKDSNEKQVMKFLYQQKSQLKNQLKECNKSITEKQLLIKLLEESSKMA